MCNLQKSRNIEGIRLVRLEYRLCNFGTQQGRVVIDRARVLKILRTFTILSHDYQGNQKVLLRSLPASLLQFSLYQSMATNSFRSREAKEQRRYPLSNLLGGGEDGDENQRL